MYQSERESIEASYWEARDQVRARLLGAVEERRRKLREEKEGGEVVSGTSGVSKRWDTGSLTCAEALLDAAIKRPVRRMPSRHINPSPPSSSASNTKPSDLLLHSLLAPSLAAIQVDDIIQPLSTSLTLVPAQSNGAAATSKRGPRNRVEEEKVTAAPGTLTALAIASGQQAPNGNGKDRSRGAGAAREPANQGQWVLGKSLSDLKRMESASQMEIESDWLRMTGTTGRGRRNRAE